MYKNYYWSWNIGEQEVINFRKSIIFVGAAGSDAGNY